ncbi:hypothetical protein KW798_01340 [Candidatus Parcubacteria bacterium]|nr:hypothetical protein [Candidatus Parcubacteria bacterium]
MKNALILIFIVAVVAVGLWWFVSSPESLGTPGQATTTVTPGNTHPSGGTTTAKPGGTAGSASGSSTTGLQTFSSTAYGFSFQYPRSMTLDKENLSAGGFTAQGSLGLAAPYARIGTVVDRFQVSVSQQAADLGNCTKDLPGSPKSSTINGQIFTTYTTEEMKGSSNITTRVHRIVHNTTCYELRETLTAPVTVNLPGSQIEQQKADTAAIITLVETVRASFKFLN